MQVDFEGAVGRGLVALRFLPGNPEPLLLDHPPLLSSAGRVTASASFTLSELNADPVRVGFAPVGELAATMNPALATDDELTEVVRDRLTHDGRIQSFGYLRGHEIVADPVLPKKRR